MNGAHDAGLQIGLNLEDQPIVCDEKTPHANLVIGEDKQTALKNEMFQLNKANNSKISCYIFNKAQIDGNKTVPKK